MTEFSSLEINNKTIQSITVNNKEVQSIIRSNDNAVIYQKESETLTLDLSTDKSILSYANLDSATITATLQGGTVSNQTVTFKQGNAVLDTMLTDANGIATFSYDSQGIGDVTITAECNNLTDSIDIEDCIYYKKIRWWHGRT